MRPVFGVHDPHRDVMMRNVTCVGFRPIIGDHFASSTGSCALMARTARSFAASFHTKTRGIIQAIGIAWIVSIAHAARIFQAIQIIRTMRTIHTVQTIEIALTDLFILGLQHGASRTFDPWFAFRHKSCDCRLRHARRCGDDDLRVRRFDAQVHVFDGFTHDGHRHSSDLRGFFG